jgi:protease IV
MTELERSGWRRVVAALWWLVDGSRRLAVNLLFVAIVAALAWGWWQSRPPALQDKTVLVLELSGALVDQRAGTSRGSALSLAQGGGRAQVQLRDLLRALDAAAKDPQITTVLLLPDELSSAGPANLREVASALTRVRAGGKKVVAWGGDYTQRQYYLAAQADEVLMHPMGRVELVGYGSLRNYYRDLFDRVGVAANVVRAGRYKNFGEPYFANAPSQETQEADAAIYGALWTDYTAAVERARKLPAGSIDQGIAELPQRLAAVSGDAARLALQAKLVDGLKTRDELRALLIQRGAPDEAAKTFRQVSLGAYLARQKAPAGKEVIAVVVAEGAIVDGDAAPGGVGGRSTSELIRQAREDDQVKALVLRVRSPGGSAFGAELIRRELELTRAAGKPVVVSMGDVAASGGYWISMAADEVIADAATLTGSIGVFGMLPTADGLLAKLPLHTAGQSTTWLTNAYDPRKPLDPRFAAMVQSVIDRIYADFIAKVATARHSTPEKIDAVAQGRVWTGEQARERGLVDRLGGFDDAVRAAAKRARLGDDWRLRYVERAPGRIDRLLNWLGPVGAEIGAALAETQTEAAALLAPAAPLGLPAPAWQLLQSELSWLAELTRRPDGALMPAAVVHCLCTPP